MVDKLSYMSWEGILRRKTNVGTHHCAANDHTLGLMKKENGQLRSLSASLVSSCVESAAGELPASALGSALRRAFVKLVSQAIGAKL